MIIVKEKTLVFDGKEIKKENIENVELNRVNNLNRISVTITGESELFKFDVDDDNLDYSMGCLLGAIEYGRRIRGN